jgi:hypothetical protein
MFLFYEWPSVIDASGVDATARVTEKREGIRIPFDNWFRRFEIVAAFRVPGDPIQRHAVCDVEQATYDSLHVGDPVGLHYWPALLAQPFIPATHLSPCTPRANFASNPEVYQKLEILLGTLLPIVFLVAVLRLRVAAWLFLPWFYFFLLTGVVPQTEPAPLQPRAALAIVRNITTITMLMENGKSGSGSHVKFGPIKLEHPFQIIQLEFTPAGMRDPVVAIDAIDLNSIPNIKAGETVSIDYDSQVPRIARMRAGTRDFPGQARRQILTLFGVLGIFFGAILVASHVRGRRRAATRTGASPGR